MTDFTSLHTKVDALKAIVAQSSITPKYLGALLDDFIAYIESVDKGAVSSEDIAETNLKVQSMTELINKFIATKGVPDGLSPLDAAAQVPEWHMPPGVFDVVGFHGFVGPDDVSIVDSQATATAGSVVCCGGRFVFRPTALKPSLGLPEAYTSWRRMYSRQHGAGIELHEVDASARYGAAGSLGVSPVQGKLYVDLTTSTPYLYDGSGLVALVTAAGVADTVAAAVARGKADGTAPLNADAQIPEWALPPRAFQVLPFGGFIRSGDYELVLQPNDGSYQSVMFYNGHFVAKPGRSYDTQAVLYTRWTLAYKEAVPGSGAVLRHTVDASLRYGTPTDLGIQPSPSKIYIDTSTHTAYIYDGEGSLVPLGASGGQTDVQAREELAELRRRLDAIEGQSQSDAIDNLHELGAFLTGVKDTDTLTGLLEQTKAEVAVDAAAPEDIDKVIDTIIP